MDLFVCLGPQGIEVFDWVAGERKMAAEGGRSIAGHFCLYTVKGGRGGGGRREGGGEVERVRPRATRCLPTDQGAAFCPP